MCLGPVIHVIMKDVFTIRNLIGDQYFEQQNELGICIVPDLFTTKSTIIFNKTHLIAFSFSAL